MFFYPLGFCEDHINNSSKVPSASACHIHGCSIHFDSFSYFWIQELLGGKKKPTLKRHLGREHDWEGLGLSYLAEQCCLRREESRMGKSHSSSGLLPRADLTWKPILKPQGRPDLKTHPLARVPLRVMWIPQWGFQNTEVCAYSQAFLVQEAWMGPGELPYSQVPKGYWCCWLGTTLNLLPITQRFSVSFLWIFLRSNSLWQSRQKIISGNESESKADLSDRNKPRYTQRFHVMYSLNMKTWHTDFYF